MKENNNMTVKNTTNILAVLLAFIIGLTVGSVERDTLVSLKEKFISPAGHSFINKENTTTNLHFTHSEHSSGLSDTNEEDEPEATTFKATEASAEKPRVISTGASTQKVDASEIEKELSAPNEKIFSVYRTPTGKRYHFSSSCAGKNSIETDFDEVSALGLTPCMKCAGS